MSYSFLRARSGVLAASLVVFGFSACSSSDAGTPNSGSGGSGADAGAAGGAAGAAGTGDTDSGVISTDGGGGDGSVLDPDASCTGVVSQAEQIPVDIHIMMDRSGSMRAETDPFVIGSATKWEAVRDALKQFLNKPESVGLGVGLAYFPREQAGAPTECTTNADCGTFGPCFRKACLVSGAACEMDSECGIDGPCANIGRCPMDTTQLCVALGDTIAGCGLCSDPGPTNCINTLACAAADYATADVDVADLPGAIGPLTTSLDAQTPDGLTPTVGALGGAVLYATAHAAANPATTVAIVLITDGNPEGCMNNDIAQVTSAAQSALNGTPSVKTFVIGVFAFGDILGVNNANLVAQSGGTGMATVVQPGANLAQQFSDALDKIRKTALACEYEIPLAPDGGTLDYNQVNVEVSRAGFTQTLPYVGSAANCHPLHGGWYYDADVSAGETPTQILICDNSCDEFIANPGGAIDIRLGCETIVIVK